MSTCSSCSEQVQPQWKFCIRCGTPVVASQPSRRPSLLVTFGILVVAVIALGLGATIVAIVVGNALG